MRSRFKVGDGVVAVRALDLQPHTVVAPGETGVVQSHDKAETFIKLDKPHKGLAEWDNCIWLNDDTSDLTSALVTEAEAATLGGVLGITKKRPFRPGLMAAATGAGVAVAKFKAIGALVGAAVTSPEGLIANWLVTFLTLSY
jgi:hypothetical protein